MKAGEQSKEWYAKNKEYQKEKSRRYYHEVAKHNPNYKIRQTANTMRLRRKRQELAAGRPKPAACEVCHRDGGVYGICWDHNHATGEFRGWLCSHCNRALGLLQDSPLILRELALYLEKSH